MPSSQPTFNFCVNDLPADLNLADMGASVAVDTEAMGLNPHRDRLCLVQIRDAHGRVWLVHFPDGHHYDKAVKLKALLTDPSIEKIFHYARFDIAVLKQYLGVTTVPLFCTKIASKLGRTFVSRHGLKDLCSDLLQIKLDKHEQSSDWGAPVLTPEQLNYAASDVLHLHDLKAILVPMLERCGRLDLAQACFDFLPHRACMDILGWQDDYIFHH